MKKKEQKSLEDALALMSEMYMTEKVNAERLEKALTAMERDRDRLLANSHVAVPGPPREDGVWIIRDKYGHEAVARRENGMCVVQGDAGPWAIFDGLIVAHRKHIPLEVPHG